MARKRRSQQIDKALPGVVTSPGAARGSVTDMSTQAAIAAAAYDITTATRGGLSVPLPRDPSWGFAPFGPGQPLYPAPLDRTRPDTGRAAPRFYEYPVSWNLTGTANRLTSWELLRAAADGVSLFRRCIEIRKDHMLGLDWDIVIGQSAIEAAQAQEGRNGAGRAALEDRLRQEMGPEIDRAATFLAMPDRGNGYEFAQWLSMLLEEVFVLDAAAIYPRRTYGGDLFAFEALDGTTIKPLLDERGGRPLPPYPAYQQILYGFPRGEFTADVRDEKGTEVIPGAYASDELIYSRRVVRTWTPYGYSAVEQALDDGDLYMKRHIWMKGEYTEGTSVAGLYKIDPAAGTGMWSPEQILTYERQFNDAYSGDLAARQGARFLPPGVEPVLDANGLSAMAERYKPEYDLHLIKLLASHFDTTLPELGFTEAKGLGSEGYHEGQADVQHRKGTLPTLRWLQQLLTTISRKHLGMPAELEFRFLGLEDEDEAAADQVAQNRIQWGRMTLNEDRDRLGLPRYPFAEADMPMVMTTRGVIFIDGASEFATPGVPLAAGSGNTGEQPAPGQTASDAEGTGDEPEDDDEEQPEPAAGGEKPEAVKAELAAFRRWARKNPSPRRPFQFQTVTKADAPDLAFDNRVVFAGGDPSPKAADLASAKQWPGWGPDQKAVAYWVPRIRKAMRGTINTRHLAEAWIAERAIVTKADEPDLDDGDDSDDFEDDGGDGDDGAVIRTDHDAAGWLTTHGVNLTAALAFISDLHAEGYTIGERSATAVVGGHATVDWSNWKPGHASAARLVQGADGSVGLQRLLNEAGVTIRSVAGNRMDKLAKALSDALARGDSADTLAGNLDDVLDDESWADMVAVTEISRAVSAATLDIYQANGIGLVSWSTAADEHTCMPCSVNEDTSPIRLGAYFPGGVVSPPQHPLCRCCLIPELGSF